MVSPPMIKIKIMMGAHPLKGVSLAKYAYKMFMAYKKPESATNTPMKDKIRRGR